MFELFAWIESVLVGFGYFALFGIVFAESGLFFGFFLPGDSLLFTSGFLASTGFFDIYAVLIGVSVSAILGDQVGYWFGRRFGKGIFNKPGSFFRDPKHITEAESFYEKHGKKTIVLARFVPGIRTFAPIVAGIGNMEYSTFITYNVIGGLLWAFIFVLAGFFLGSLFPNAGEMLTFAILGIIIISLIPIGIKLVKK